MFGRLAMGFAHVRAGTRVLMLVLVQVYLAFFKLPSGVHGSSVPMMLFLARPAAEPRLAAAANMSRP